MLVAYAESDFLHTSDYYALRTEQLKFLGHLTRAYFPCGVPLVVLPNLAFSRALALFRTHGSGTGLTTAPPAASAASAEPSAVLLEGNTDAAGSLVRAILTFPGCVALLLEKMDVDTSSAAVAGTKWSDVLSRKLFLTSAASGSTALLERLSTIFAARQHTEWSSDEVNTWHCRRD